MLGIAGIKGIDLHDEIEKKIKINRDRKYEKRGGTLIRVTEKATEAKIVLDQYRDPWMAQMHNEWIGFYPREYYPLDNFSSFKITYGGTTYASVEEAYQALGFIDSAPEIYDRIVNSASAHEAKKIAHENKDKRRSDWVDVRADIMENLLRAKIKQHPYVRKKLLETKDYELVEDSPKDSFYGIGVNRDGKNVLGKMWMKLRNELKNEADLGTKI